MFPYARRPHAATDMRAPLEEREFIMSIRSVLIITGIALASSLSAQEVPTALIRATETDIFVTIKRNYNGSLTITSPAGKQTHRMRGKDLMEAVDRIEDAGAVFKGTRLYLRDEVTQNNEPRDSPRARIEFAYKVIGKKTSAISKDLSSFTSRTVSDHEKPRARGLGGWVGLPLTMTVGATTKVDLVAMFADLADLERTPDHAVAELKLKKHDEKKSIAKFAGTFTAKSSEDFGGGQLVPSIYSGKCRMTIDLKAQRLLTLDVDGVNRLDGSVQGAKVTGTVKFKAQWKAAYGKVATRARKKKIKYRPVERTVEEYGVAFALPSHYQYVAENVVLGDGLLGFMTGLEGLLELRRVGVRRIASPNPVGDIISTMNVSRKQRPESTFSDCKTALGSGRCITGDSDGNTVVQDFIAVDGAILVVTISYPKEHAKKGAAEVAMVRSTLREL